MLRSQQQDKMAIKITRKSRHKIHPSTVVLLGFMVIFSLIFISALLTSDDIDEVCDSENTILFRNDTTWDCMTVVYGELSGEDLVQALPVQSTYYNVTNLTFGHSNGAVADGDGIMVLSTGAYRIGGQIAFNGAGNTEYHLALGIDGGRVNHCHTQRKIGTGNDVGSASFTCIDDLVAGQVLTVMVENVDSTAGINILDINLNFVRLDK